MLVHVDELQYANMCTRGAIQAEPRWHFEVDAMCIIRSTGVAPAASVAGAADVLAERNLRGAVLPFALWKGQGFLRAQQLVTRTGDDSCHADVLSGF